MTERKSVEEKAFNKPRERKRVAFSAPKDAATETVINEHGLTPPLFRVPLEVRNHIWREVLGDRLIHFRYRSNKEGSDETNDKLHIGMNWSQELQVEHGGAWRHVICKEDSPEAQEERKFRTPEGEVLVKESHHACESRLRYHLFPPDRIYKKSCDIDHEMMRLSVLRSCRQIYVEANNILYASNTFSFADATTFKRFLMTRTSNQKRLIKSLRLQMTWVQSQWNKSLNMSLIRSLSALRRLRVNIEHMLPPFGSYESAKRSNLLYVDCYLDGLKKLSTLPLTDVEIVVESPRHLPENYLWTKEDRQDYAEGLRNILLKPKGAQIYD